MQDDRVAQSLVDRRELLAIEPTQEFGLNRAALAIEGDCLLNAVREPFFHRALLGKRVGQRGRGLDIGQMLIEEDHLLGGGDFLLGLKARVVLRLGRLNRADVLVGRRRLVGSDRCIRGNC